MEPATVLAVVSLVVSGVLAVWKIVSRISRSRCVMKMGDGTEIRIQFDEVIKELEEQPELKSMDEKTRNNLKETIRKVMDKNKGVIPSTRK